MKFKNIIDLLKGITGSKLGFRGEGGSIPFMNMLSDMFPKAKFIVTGVLGPGSNAHSANESLDLDYVKKLTMTMTEFVTKYRIK